MASPVESGSALASTSLEAFFRQTISRAIHHQGVNTRDVTLDYLVGLLTHFSRSENLFDYCDEGIRLRPLAQLYAQAARCESLFEQRLVMRRMGDVALFIAGMFSGFFRRRRALVGQDYYIAMGGQAYACLSSGRGAGDPVLNSVYAQLAESFGLYVRVLSEVRDGGVQERVEGWSAMLAEARDGDAAVFATLADMDGLAGPVWRH